MNIRKYTALVFILVTFLASSILFQNATVVEASKSQVRWDELSTQLQGFGRNTTGGLSTSKSKGMIYEITDLGDYSASQSPRPGTLRYGIEKSDVNRPLWIKLSPKFLGKSVSIVLKRWIEIKRNNLTIDGRGSKLNIKSIVDWKKYKIVPQGNRYACAPVSTQDKALTTLLWIHGAQNVIITNVTFTRDRFKSPFAEEAVLDKECLGDLISVSSRPKIPATNIWINKSTFQRCGDGCIDLTRGIQGKKNLVTISNNLFNQGQKTMLLGGSIDEEGKSLPASARLYHVSLYGNYFYKCWERNPKVSFSVVHSYNNLFEDWKMYVVGAPSGLVFMENNLLKPASIFRLIPVTKEFTFLEGNISVSGAIKDNLDSLDFVAKRDEVIDTSYDVRPASGLSLEDFKTAGNN